MRVLPVGYPWSPSFWDLIIPDPRGGVPEPGWCFLAQFWALEGIIIRLNFRHAFFPLFFSILTPRWLPFGPLWRFRVDFGPHVGSLFVNFGMCWHPFFKPWFYVDFLSTFSRFLGAQNHVFYCKTNSFMHFRRFRTKVKKWWFCHPFWRHFEYLLAYFSCLFRHLFLHGCLTVHFSDFGLPLDDLGAAFMILIEKWSPKRSGTRGRSHPRTTTGRSKKRIRNTRSTFYRFCMDSEWISGGFLMNFGWNLDGFQAYPGLGTAYTTKQSF